MIIDRIRSVTAAGIAKSAKAPVFIRDIFPGAVRFEDPFAQAFMCRVGQALLDSPDELADVPDKASTAVRESSALIKAGLNLEEPRKVMLQALLANLRDHCTLLPYRQILTDEWKVKLV